METANPSLSAEHLREPLSTRQSFQPGGYDENRRAAGLVAEGEQSRSCGGQLPHPGSGADRWEAIAPSGHRVTHLAGVLGLAERGNAVRMKV